MIRAFLLAACAAVALAVAACASTEANTPAQRVFAVKADYLTALQVAAGYERLPRCAAGQTIVDACSDAGAVAEIRRADLDAKAALDAAEEAVRDPRATGSSIGLALSAAERGVGVLRRILANRGLLK